jgi:hypothetical protein
VPVYLGVSTNPYVKQPEPDCRVERVTRLEDTVIMLKDRVNQCSNRIKVLETTPLVPPPSKNWRTLSESLKELWDKMDALQVANYEITRSLSKIMPDHTNWTTQTKWVEEELEAIKNTATERVCQHCKWGTKNPNNKMKVDCHNQPYYNVNPHNYWCKEWTEK